MANTPTWVTDSRLSASARGVMAYLVTLPEGADMSVTATAAQYPESRATIGRAMAELQAAGYLSRDVRRDETGRMMSETHLSHNHRYLSHEPISDPSHDPSQEPALARALGSSSPYGEEEEVVLLPTSTNEMDSSSTTPGVGTGSPFPWYQRDMLRDRFAVTDPDEVATWQAAWAKVSAGDSLWADEHLLGYLVDCHERSFTPSVARWIRFAQQDWAEYVRLSTPDNEETPYERELREFREINDRTKAWPDPPKED